MDDVELGRLYSEAAALVVPNVEEFGLVAVEAQAAGRPVVGINRGGVSETVIDGDTGMLVPDGDKSALARALRSDFTRFDPRLISAHAQGFSREVFQTRLREVVENVSRAAPAGPSPGLPPGDLGARRGARAPG